jgi:RNA polymerase sigma-70 factor (ECF subfamily)
MEYSTFGEDCVNPMEATAFAEAMRRQPDAALMAEALTYQKHITGFIRHKFPYLREEDLEDIVQEVYVILAHRLETFRGASSLKTWLTRVAWNAAKGFSLRVVRHRDREAPLEVVGDAPEGETLPHAASTPEAHEGLIREETAAMVHRCLDALPPEYGDIVRLADLEGLRNREIAAALNLSVPAVKSRLHRGREQMREMLAPFMQA